MTDPTTPTGKRLREDQRDTAHEHRERLCGHDDGTLERLPPRCQECLAEGAAPHKADAERLAVAYHDNSVETRELCRRCAAWHDESEAAYMTWRSLARALALHDEATR